MFPSVEVRWFVRGELPTQVIDWYEDAVGLVDWKERTDRYINPVAADGLNVKWREGNIEVKRRVDVVGEAGFGMVRGSVERWRKWSFPLSDDLPMALSGRDWTGVSKRRSVRMLTMREDHLVLTKPGEHLAHGCGVEIVDLKMNHESWWSVGLEAFGLDAEARELIRQVGERVFGDADPGQLHLENSMSYVRWLFTAAPRLPV